MRAGDQDDFVVDRIGQVQRPQEQFESFAELDLVDGQADRCFRREAFFSQCLWINFDVQTGVVLKEADGFRDRLFVEVDGHFVGHLLLDGDGLGVLAGLQTGHQFTTIDRQILEVFREGDTAFGNGWIDNHGFVNTVHGGQEAFFLVRLVGH